MSYAYPDGAKSNTLATVAWERDDLTCADPPDRITETLSLDVDLAGRRQRAYTKKFPALATDYVSLGYDSGGRLSLIDGGNWEYQYDHTEQRRTKLGVTSADDTYFFYNPSGQLLTEDRADLGLDYIVSPRPTAWLTELRPRATSWA
ncbi:MAG: hypothetical protein AAF219_11070 [Myxococcota bacterium]